MSEKKLLQFGAGNIGRSFIAQVFSAAGYEVVFVDVNAELVGALNARRSYRVVLKENESPDQVITVSGVRAVLASDTAAVCNEMADAAVIATAVGKNVLPAIAPLIAAGLRERERRGGNWPLDIILAENARGAADHMRSELKTQLPGDFPLGSRVGLVESSIGKMVPIMRPEDLARDPLWVFAEPYNHLILNGKGFLGPVPEVPGIDPVKNIAAWMDRKLFIHNLGHAAAAYLGFRQNPELRFIYEALELPAVAAGVRLAMEQSARALHREYPDDFTVGQLQNHIDDLLRRFSNRALGDTVYRVGRDLPRKLSRDDRLTGALLLAKKHGCDTRGIVEVIRAAVVFKARDSKGELFTADREFHRQVHRRGLPAILRETAGLSVRDLVPESSEQAA